METVVINPKDIKKASPEVELWKEYQIKEQQETPNRIEDAAKFLATMVSISMTIFLSIFGKDGIAKLAKFEFAILLGLWSASLFCSFFVIFPRLYNYSSHSIHSFRKIHTKVVKRKRLTLFLSVTCYFLALFLLGLFIII